VTYEGGSSTVTVNQRVNGGQWNLLGTFPMNAAGTGYKVDLADSSASGKVVADAIYYVRDSAPVDSFTWTPDITTAGDYQLYARWTASSANASTAQYTVVHGGGTSLVTVNQKQNGGQWNLLGTWSFAPGAGHQITLTASADGNVIADAIRLVGTGPAPADLVYLHTDQIGLPQKITDATQTVVWDRVQDPFGRQVSLTNSGGIDTSLRFPGQQADPIGLAGGVNRYGYVGGNPINELDAYGLSVDPDPSTSGLVKPWLLGTAVHGEFSKYVDSLQGNFIPNSSLAGVFHPYRPDVSDPTQERVWELKPEVCLSGHKRTAAIAQLQRYAAKAGGDWVVGNSDALFPRGPQTRNMVYMGSAYSIRFYPDPQPSSGLIFYRIERVRSIMERLGDALEQPQGTCGCEESPGDSLPYLPPVPAW
jgi:hypothetical protein